jgi:Spy/CpxP family protein refolding chaperone
MGPEGVEPLPADQPPMNPRRPDRLQLLRVLGLTREQLLLARQLQQRYGPRVQQVHDELEELQDAFHQAIFSEPYDPQLVEQRLQQVLQKQQEAMRAQVEQERAFREILTPQQLEKFRDLQARQMEIRRLQRALRDQQRQLNQEFQGNRP